MMKIFLLFLVASVYAESVRDMETWMPKPDTGEDLASSGDSPNSSDFGFHKEYDRDDEDDYDDEVDNYDDLSGSGAGEGNGEDDLLTSSKTDVNDNKIPDEDGLNNPRPTVNERELVQNNEVGQRAAKDHMEVESNVLMSHAKEESIFNKTEVIAALIVGGAFGLVFAVLLILLLVYRMRKKDEGTYDLGKRPIYKKAPTTEVFA